MGTNSFHLIVVKLKNDGSLKIIDREREVIRLGSHQGEGLSIITDEETNLAVKTLKKFKRITDLYNSPVKAVATSAVREASNNKEFIEKIKSETGISVDIIDGKKEAKLIYLGAEKSLGLKDKKALCIDIGGGSTEIIFSDNNKIEFAESLKIGAVRLTKIFFPDYILSADKIKKCEDYAEEIIFENKNLFIPENLEISVGTSGTIQSAALIAEAFKRR